MAVGFSGSNEGISRESAHKIFKYELLRLRASPRWVAKLLQLPLEISYFVNNECQLSCRHCYVGPKETEGSLSVGEWQEVFAECLRLGARTFGAVGKEPLLVWDKTLALLRWFKEQKETQQPLDLMLRYGLVTNGIALDERKIADLAEVSPTYVDISFDGTKPLHDHLRGQGMYDRVFSNVAKFPDELKQRVFISFTANRVNNGSLSALVDELYSIGIRNFLISPYVSTRVGVNENWPDLVDDDATIALYAQRLLGGEQVDWRKYTHLRIYFKTDYTTSRGVMDELVLRGIINPGEMLIDEYGTIFNRYVFGSNEVYFNFIPFDDTLIRSVRIGHDGFVSGCHAMFFGDERYRSLASGNVRETLIGTILDSA